MPDGGQKIYLNGAENAALDLVADNVVAMAAYLTVKRRRNYRLDSWCTCWASFAKLLGLKGRAGIEKLRRAAKKLEDCGLLTKRENKIDKGIVLTLPLADIFAKNGDMTTTPTTTLSTTPTTTPWAYSGDAATTGIFEGAQDVDDTHNDTHSDSVNVQVATPLSINKIKTNNNNNKNARVSDCRVDSEVMNRTLGEYKKIPAKTGVQHPQRMSVASEGEASPAGTSPVDHGMGTSPIAASQGAAHLTGSECIADAGGSSSWKIPSASAGQTTQLAAYFATKDGIQAHMSYKLMNGRFADMFLRWLGSGLTVEEIKNFCKQNDENWGAGDTMGWYNKAVMAHVEAKKNPPVPRGMAGQLSGSHSQVREEHHDLPTKKSQPDAKLVEMLNTIFGLSSTQTVRLCNEYGESFVQGKIAIALADEDWRSGKITNAQKFFWGKCKHDAQIPKTSTNIINHEDGQRLKQREEAKAIEERDAEIMQERQNKYNAYVNDYIAKQSEKHGVDMSTSGFKDSLKSIPKLIIKSMRPETERIMFIQYLLKNKPEMSVGMLSREDYER